MCGIAGIFNITSGHEVTEADLWRMVVPMRHRGPDAEGVFLHEGRAGICNVRLAILDLRPESNQPFAIEDGDLTIVYNGELFNYIELRKELKALGHSFRTDSDTEVVLRAYREWGKKCLQRFNGMWGFAVYDRKKHELFCARDRFGIKPFNYAIHQGEFLFASEIKSIIAVAPDLAEPDYDSLSLLLRAGIGAERAKTCFKGIERLRPAHCATVTRDGVTVERWWDFPSDQDVSISREDAPAGLRELLTDAVRLRMRSDVPVGLTLSSGLDSSSVACTLRTFFDGPFDTFTASYEGEPYDESSQAKALADSVGMTPNLIPAVPDDFLGTVREIIWHLESPTHTPAVFPLWNIAKYARSKVTVLLEGQGADEVLAGYKPNFYEAVLDRALKGRLAAAAGEIRWSARTMGVRESLLLAGRRANPGSLHRLYRLMRGDEKVYIGPLARGPERDPSRRKIPRKSGWLNASLVNQIESGLVNLLHYGDAISMAHSLESRNPFLDYRLVEFATRLPGEYKFDNGTGKTVLREAMKGVVPDDILLSRAKLGFPTPIARWFREKPEDTVYPVLRSAQCRARGIFSPQRMEEAISKHRSGKADLSGNIFRWILTELWFQQFID